MTKKVKSFMAAAAIAVACLFSASPASAQLTYDKTITAIYGSGNPDTGWTESPGGDVMLAMRAKNREDGNTTNASGVYSMPVGYQVGVINRARWNFEFSMNSGLDKLDKYDYYLGIDTDPSIGISHTIFDVMAIPDNSYGNAATQNGQGVEGTAATYAGVYSIAQQSHNIRFYSTLANQDPNLHATFDYCLYAVEKGEGALGGKLNSVNIRVVVGAGGASPQQLIDELAVGAKNHGAFMAKVNALLIYLREGDAIEKADRQALHKTAAQRTIPTQP